MDVVSFGLNHTRQSFGEKGKPNPAISILADYESKNDKNPPENKPKRSSAPIIMPPLRLSPIAMRLKTQ